MVKQINQVSAADTTRDIHGFARVNFARPHTSRAEFGDSLDYSGSDRIRPQGVMVLPIAAPFMAARWEARKGLPVHASGPRFANLSGRRHLFLSRRGGVSQRTRPEASHGCPLFAHTCSRTGGNP